MNIQRPFNGNPNFQNQNFGQGFNQNAFNPAAFNNVAHHDSEYNQLPSASLHRTLDASQRQQSPMVQGSAYNVNPVIPAKRSRVGEEDNDTMSPGPMPGQFNMSRSQTPSQPGFPTPRMGFPQGQGANLYQHLQHATPNGMAPSPHTQQQPFPLPGRPPSTNAQSPRIGMMPNASTVVNPSLLGPQHRPNAMGMPAQRGVPQQPPNMQPDAVREAQARYRQQLEVQQRHLTSVNPAVQNRPNAPGMPVNGTSGNTNMHMNMNTNNSNNPMGMPPNRATMQPPNQATQNKSNAAGEQFFNSLKSFLSRQGQTLDPNPVVCGRPINYHQLFSIQNACKVLYPGTANYDNWSVVATNMGMSPAQYPTAPQELRDLFQRNLFGFFREWLTSMQKRKQQLQQAQQGSPGQSSPQSSDVNRGTPQFSPPGVGQPFNRQQQPQALSAQGPPDHLRQHGLSQQGPPGQPLQQNTVVNRGPPQFSPSGMNQPSNKPQQPQAPPAQAPPDHLRQQSVLNGHMPSSLSQSSPLVRNDFMTRQGQSLDSVIPKRQASAEQAFGVGEVLRQGSSQAPSRGPEAESMSISTPDKKSIIKTPSLVEEVATEPKAPPQDPEHYVPRRRFFGIRGAETPSSVLRNGVLQPDRKELYQAEHPLDKEYHGGYPVDELARMGEELALVRPGIPSATEMGMVDLQALSLSVQSGKHGEMRYALDHLVGLSNDARLAIDLHECECVLEALYDCGDDQLDMLSEHCPRMLDQVEFPNFERLSKEAAKETHQLLVTPAFASTDHELEHAVDRLVAITTILRNFSIPDSKNNHDMLCSESSAGFVASMIHRIGTRPGILRTSRNLMDFMKDIVTLLSNISHRLDILSHDDASAILRFLVAFAPEDSPGLNDQADLTFQPYDPKRHQYLPSAIDSLAKLLARYEPNRSYFKTIFQEDRATTPESMLLTRTFALAVAPVPDRQSSTIIANRGDMIRLAQERNPFLSQGMLAGDILSTMLQGADDKLARHWLGSADGWAPSLLYLLMRLPEVRDIQTRRDHQGRLVEYDAGGCSVITQRGLGMLKRLAEKVEKLDDGDDGPLFGIVPDRERLLYAALTPIFESGSLKELMGFAALEG